MNTIKSDTVLVRQIVEVLDDQKSFTNGKEDEIKGKLASAYATFAKDRKLELDHVSVSGMRSRMMGGLCGDPPEDYLIGGIAIESLRLWIRRRYEKQKYVRSVRIDSWDKHLKLAAHLKKLFEEQGIEVSIESLRPPSTEKEETDWTDRIDNRPDHSGGGRFY